MRLRPLFFMGALGVLEPDDGKLSSPVLRGLSGRKAARLPGSNSIPVAVGTTIADRPPRRSVQARLRIRPLRRMGGVEACIGIGVQNAGRRNPPAQDWGKTFPTHLCALTTADQSALP